MAPYYVSEIAETSMRGALASLMQLMVTFGVLFVNALNIYDTVHWVTISGICIGIPGKKVFLLPNYLQCNLDLVVVLVSAKAVTKSHKVTKSNDFM